MGTLAPAGGRAPRNIQMGRELAHPRMKALTHLDFARIAQQFTPHPTPAEGSMILVKGVHNCKARTRAPILNRVLGFNSAKSEQGLELMEHVVVCM